MTNFSASLSAVAEPTEQPVRILAPPAPRLTSSSLLARNATLNLFGEGWTFLVLLVAMPKLVTFLGETSFGLFSLAWVVIGYLSFLDIGVNRAATKFISEHLAERDEESICSLVRTAFLANLVLGVIGGIAVALTAPFLIHSVFKVSPQLVRQATFAFYAVGVAVPVLLVQGILRAVLSSYQRFGWINGVNVVAVTLQWGSAGWLAWRGHGVAVVVIATVIARLLATGTYGVLLWRVLPRMPFHRSQGLSGLFKLLKFGSWVSVSQVISPVLVYLDRMLIASFVSLGAVTLYTVPYEAIFRLRIIPSSLMATLFPAFSERGSEGSRSRLQELYIGSLRYLLVLIVPLFALVGFVGKDLLSIWMGSAFAMHSSAVLQFLALGVFFNALACIPYNALQALGRPDITGKFHLLELPIYILLCILLIPRWGLIGAATANSFRLGIDAFLLFWAAWRYCACPVRVAGKNGLVSIVKASFLFCSLLVLERLFLSGALFRLGAALSLSCIYYYFVWTSILTERERASIIGALLARPGRLTAQ